MKPNRKQRALEDMKQRILTLDMAPGHALDEQQLCETYGLSRTPLREIFQQLAGEGYITLAPNRGAAVSSMDLAAMRTFFQTAPMIYASVARLAAENRTAHQIAELKATQKSFSKSIKGKSPAHASMHNHRFHEIIGDMAANPYLTPSLNRLLIDHTRMSRTFYRPQAIAEQKRIRTACDQHDAMIDAIEAREPAQAVALTLQHWDLSRNQIEKYVQPDPLPLEGFEETAETKKHAV